MFPCAADDPQAAVSTRPSPQRQLFLSGPHGVDVFQFDQMKERIFEQLESYSGIPFTVQRLCELLVQPKRHYKRTDKFMRGLEKIMLVVSTIDPNPSSEEAESEPPELARTDTI